jgi:hypothetical protein
MPFLLRKYSRVCVVVDFDCSLVEPTNSDAGSATWTRDGFPVICVDDEQIASAANRSSRSQNRYLSTETCRGAAVTREDNYVAPAIGGGNVLKNLIRAIRFPITDPQTGGEQNHRG